MTPGTPVKIGISSCLLGENVRYDGRNKYAGYIVAAFAPYVDFIPVCPETAIGLGVPRPPLRLVGMNGRISAVGANDPAIDVTEALTGFGKKQARLLNAVCGYIFKNRSPSCGLVDTPISIDGEERNGAGLYTRQIIAAMPLLPVADETSLALEKSTNYFLERVFAYRRWQQLLETPLSVASLRIFHTLNTPELERHHAKKASELTDFLFSVEDPLPGETAQRYLQQFMAILQMPAALNLTAEERFENHARLAAALDHHPG